MKLLKCFTSILLASILIVSNTHLLHARIKLTTLPNRELTTIRLDNVDSTLIEEERVLTLQQGLNTVDFSWKGVNIDEDSIRIEILDHPNEVNLLNVSYPPNESALVWQIASTKPFKERVRISYLLYDIDRLTHYKLIVNKEESLGNFKHYLVLRNFSGENFANANVLLNENTSFKQNIQHEETKQVVFNNLDDIKIQKVWTWDSRKQPWDPDKVNTNVGIPVIYKITNTKPSGLGNGLLSSGKIRVYQKDGHGGSIFSGEDKTSSIAVGEDMEIAIGQSRDIVVTQKNISNRKINIRKNKQNRTVLFDKEQKIEAKIENFKDSPTNLELIQHMPKEWEMSNCNIDYEKKDAHTLKFHIALGPKEKKELKMHYVIKNLRR